MELFKKILIFFVPIALLLILVNYMSPGLTRDDNAFYMATVDKEHTLATTPAPRMILTGGSAVAFGLNAVDLQKATGRNVINMGLSAEFGLKFILNETSSYIQSGDVVILSTDYFLSDGDKKVQAFLFDNNPNAAKFLAPSLKDRMLYTIYHFQRIASALFYKHIHKSDVYLRNAFDGSGDLTLNTDAASTYSGEVIKLKNHSYLKEIARINDFITKCNKQNVRVYFSYPPSSASFYNANKGVIRGLDSVFRATLKCPILDSPTSYVYADKYFFDHFAHLNATGREMRTQRLIEDLQLTKIQ